MPKTPSNYQNCVIYKLVSFDTTLTECYVGHTTNFTQRKKNHKNSYFNENHPNHFFPVYEFMREHGGWENFIMLQMEEFPCETKREAEIREEYWRKELNATLNGHQCFTTTEEKKIKNRKRVAKFNKKNPTYMKEYNKEYYEANKDKKKLYMKDYRLRKKLEKLNLTETI